jgi:hypothetical protein
MILMMNASHHVDDLYENIVWRMQISMTRHYFEVGRLPAMVILSGDPMGPDIYSVTTSSMQIRNEDGLRSFPSHLQIVVFDHHKPCDPIHLRPS